jgi:hypothetical protein
MAGGTRGSTRTRSVQPAHLLDVHAFQLWWWPQGHWTGPFTCVHGWSAVEAATAFGPV